MKRRICECGHDHMNTSGLRFLMDLKHDYCQEEDCDCEKFVRA